MSRGGGLFLLAGTTFLAGSQNLIMVVERGESESQFGAGASQDPLQGGDARLPLAALDPCYLRLSYPGSFG